MLQGEEGGLGAIRTLGQLSGGSVSEWGGERKERLPEGSHSPRDAWKLGLEVAQSHSKMADEAGWV